MNNNRFKTALRSFFTPPVVILCYLYVMALTCSMSGMEITSWGLFLFLTIFVVIDRFNEKPVLEFHTLGIEIPLVLFIIIVIAGLKINAPDGDFWFALGSLRNFILLFAFTYALQIVRNLNRLFGLLLVCATIVAIYGLWQHYSGIDILNVLNIRKDQSALVKVPWSTESVYSVIGLFSHHLTFGHSFAMILCFPWAALLLMNRRVSWFQALFFLVSFCVILTAVIFTYGRGVWIALIVSLPLMAFFTNKKLFLSTVAILAVATGILYRTDSVIRERILTVFADSYVSNEDRRKLWQINMEMFHEHPWIGVGYKQNEPLSQPYYEKMKIENGMSGHAHSNYVELLATTGILGFACYMLIIMSFVLTTFRLYTMVPNTHYWHKVFVLAALGAQITFHVGGLTQWNFGDAEVQHQFLFWLAVISYMTHKYYSSIVSDDYNL